MTVPACVAWLLGCSAPPSSLGRVNESATAAKPLRAKVRVASEGQCVDAEAASQKLRATLAELGAVHGDLRIAVTAAPSADAIEAHGANHGIAWVGDEPPL